MRNRVDIQHVLQWHEDTAALGFCGATMRIAAAVKRLGRERMNFGVGLVGNRFLMFSAFSLIRLICHIFMNLGIGR